MVHVSEVVFCFRSFSYPNAQAVSCVASAVSLSRGLSVVFHVHRRSLLTKQPFASLKTADEAAHLSVHDTRRGNEKDHLFEARRWNRKLRMTGTSEGIRGMGSSTMFNRKANVG